ncbi:hypothetical protein Tco_0597873 [Tanacetum coccineum]
MVDYGFNFMNTKIHIDNEITICIVKNPVFHSKTKHFEIRHHFIRDSYEKRLIQVIKIHTDHNVADLLIKAFDVSSDEFGVKTGSCKVNAARQDLVPLGKVSTTRQKYSLTISPTIYASYIEQFWSTAKTKIVNNETQIHAKVDGKTIVISESSVRSNLHFNDEDGVTSLTNSEILENLALMGYEIISDKLTFQKAFFSPQWNVPPKKVGDEAIYTREDDKVVRAATTATSLEAEQESGSRPRCQDTTLGDADAHTRFETASKQSRDLPLSKVNTSGSGEDSMEHQDDLTDFVPPTPHDSSLSGGHTPRSDEGRPNINKLMAICTNLSNRVLALETSKTAQDLVINKLKKKVKCIRKRKGKNSRDETLQDWYLQEKEFG